MTDGTSIVRQGGTRRIGGRLIAAAAGVLLFAGVSGFPAAPPAVHASNAPANGCPRGFQFLSVADLTDQGYRVPALVDSPANGGNGDGYVCARALGNRTTSWGGQLYGFEDNQLPASTVAH